MAQLKGILSKLSHSLRLSPPSTLPAPAPDGPAQESKRSLNRSSVQAPMPVSPPKETSAQVSVAEPAPPPLENLPPEVRRQVLATLELDGLKALVHASPVFHRQYLLDRRFLLCTCFEATLGGLAADAWAVYRSGMLDSSAARTKERVIQFLGSFADRRSATTQPSILTEDVAEEEAVGLVAFHHSVIKPAARLYVNWTSSNLFSEPETAQPWEPLSKTEEMRLMRALYRFQLCCNLFGAGSRDLSPRVSMGFQSVEILNHFICLFEPWEVEEIACIYAFAKNKYDDIFRAISWDVNEKNPKFDGQRPPTPEGAFDLDNSWVRDSLLKGTISRGLELLLTVVRIDSHSELVSAMQQQISWPAGNFLEDEALGETAQFHRRQHHPSDRDERQQRRDPLPFESDAEASPPLAWTMIWAATSSNLYGYYIQDDIRSWGYVLWDAARLRRTGAEELLMRQWDADWGGSDPRDNLL